MFSDANPTFGYACWDCRVIVGYTYKDFLDDKKSWTLIEEQMFAHKNCALVR